MDIRKFYIDAFHMQDCILLNELVKNSEYKKVKKGTVLVKEGATQNTIFFLLSGAVQGIWFNENGREFVDCIMCDFGDLVVASFDFCQPSPVTLKALLPSEIVCIPLPAIQDLLTKHRELEGLYISFTLKALEKHREAKQMLQEVNLSCRYQWFAQNYSRIVDAIPQKTIASFIGVSETWFCKQNPRKKK